MYKLKKLMFILFVFTLVLLTANSKVYSQTEQKTPISDVLYEIIINESVEAALEQYRYLKENKSKKYDFSENQLNRLGYRLLGEGLIKESLEIFKLNIEAYPESVNPYDSMAEAYLNDGNKELAIEYYNKALKINPNFNASIGGLNKIYTMDHYEKHEYKIPMRDGKKLFTQVYTPINMTEKCPIMFLHTPYDVGPYGENKLDYRNVLGPSTLFTKEGFIFVYQDARGKYMSEGEFIQMKPLELVVFDSVAIDESTDIYDTIEWLLENIPNNNGKVGMWGISYPGVYAAMGLVNAHPALVAVSPQAPPSDWFMGDDWHHNGAFFWFQAVNWMRSSGVYRPEPTTEFAGRLFTYPTSYLYDFFLDVGTVANINERYFKDQVPFWNSMVEHGSYDDFWKERSTLPHFKNVKPAVMTVGGWFDAENLYGALKTYSAIENQNPGIQNTLVFGPWYHGGWA